MDADGKNVRQLTHTPRLLQRRAVLLARRQEGHLPQRPQARRTTCSSTSSTPTARTRSALTDDLNWVNWGPYWYKDGKHIIYAGADHSNPAVRPNYDLYWMNIETGKKVRITHAPGADVLPVFSPDYKKLMWTSTRDGRQPSQLYIADFTAPKE